MLFILVTLSIWFLKVYAYKDGKVIIDTAAGVLGRYDPRPVQPDSLFSVFSVTKGITAGMLHWLVDNGYVVVIEWKQSLFCVKIYWTVRQNIQFIFWLIFMLQETFTWNTGCMILPKKIMIQALVFLHNLFRNFGYMTRRFSFLVST